MKTSIHHHQHQKRQIPRSELKKKLKEHESKTHIIVKPGEETDALSCARRADEQRRDGSIRSALVSIDKALELNPIEWRFYALRAIIHLALNDMDCALEDCGCALDLHDAESGPILTKAKQQAELFGGDLVLYTRLFLTSGLAKLSLGRKAEARAELQRFIDSFPHSVPHYHIEYSRALVYLGNCIESKDQAVGYWKKAEKHCDQQLKELDHVTSKSSNRAARMIKCAAYSIKADAENMLGDYTSAIDDYNRAIEMVPTDAEAFDIYAHTFTLARTQAKISAGQWQSAQDDLDSLPCVKYLETHKDQPELDYHCGLMLRLKGKCLLKLSGPEQAIENINQAMKIAEKDEYVELLANLFFDRAKIYYEQNKLEDALDDLRGAVSLLPKTSADYHNIMYSMYMIKGSILFSLEQWRNASMAFSVAYMHGQTNTEKAEALFQEGLCDLKRNVSSRALQCFNKALEFDQSNAKYQEQRDKAKQLVESAAQQVQPPQKAEPAVEKAPGEAEAVPIVPAQPEEVAEESSWVMKTWRDIESAIEEGFSSVMRFLL